MRSDKTKQLVPFSIDQVLAVLLLPVIIPLLALLYIIVVPLQGRPFLFSAERMRGPSEAFTQFKIRTMQPVDRLSCSSCGSRRRGCGARGTATARALAGGLPGITGLATVLLHTREERLLSACRNAAETDRVYREQCIPLKIRLDELYSRRKSLRLKAFILWRTVSRLALGQASLGFIKTMLRGQKSQKATQRTFDQLSRNARLK